MIGEAPSLAEKIREIESVFFLLADYTRDIILGDKVFNEISCIQYGILLYLESNEKVTVQDIVKSQNLSYSSSTQLLDELSSLGLVSRCRSGEDRRLVFVSITEKGREMTGEILKRRHKALTLIFEDFKPEEMELMMDTFTILKNKLVTLKDKN